MPLEQAWIYVLSVNGILFFMMGLDKWKAIHHRWRISEKMLLSLGILGGGIGGWLGLLLFNHKKSKWYFKLAYLFGALVSLLAICYYRILNENS